MAGKDFKVGDLVMAKTEHFPFLPARIEKLGPCPKTAKKAQHYVFFLGSKNYAWVLEECIASLSERMIKPSKKLPSSALNGIGIRFSKKTTEPNTEGNTNQKKAQVVKRVRENRNPKKCPAHSSLDNRSPHKAKKVDDDSALLDNVPSCSGGSRGVVGEEPISEVKRPKSPEAIPSPDDEKAQFNVQSTSGIGKTQTDSTTQKKIGVLGLGKVGQAVVKNLLDLKYAVTVWNRTAEKCQPFVGSGANLGLSPSDVVAKSDITFCCVSDPEASLNVAFGPCGALEGLAGHETETKGYVEMTSIDPNTSQKIGEAISKAGGMYLEAPVNWTKDGKLLVITAGEKKLYLDCVSCLSAIASKVHFLGITMGAASKVNLIQSTLSNITYAVVAEAITYIDHCNIPRKFFVDILNLCNRGCPIVAEITKVMTEFYSLSDADLKHM